MNVFHRHVIPSSKGVPANNGNLLQHFQSVSQVADFRAFVVSPAYWNFDNAIAALEGDEQNLGVKAPALNCLQLENGLGGGAGKRLESTLCVGEMQSHYSPNDGVEAAAEDLTVEGLAMGLPVFFQPARRGLRVPYPKAGFAVRRSKDNSGTELKPRLFRPEPDALPTGR